MVHGENQADGFTGREMNQGGIGKVHGAICVVIHESLDLGQFVVRNRRHPDCTRAQQPPNARQVTKIAVGQVKNFSEDSLCRQQWEVGVVVGLDAGPVPPVATVKQRQNGASVNQRADGHIFLPVFS